MNGVKIGSASLAIVLVFISSSCKKGSGPAPKDPGDTTVILTPPVEPPLANTIGFFLNDWQPKTFTPPSYINTSTSPAADYSVTIDPSAIITKIPRSFAGSNSNLWMTQMVTEPLLINHLTNLHPHIIRFPGGSISDVFFWNAEKNAKPPDVPDNLLSSTGSLTPGNYWYGKNADGWTLSIENYYSMLQQTGNQGIITINYGYARYGTGPDPVATAAHLAADWVRYDNGRTQYWEIGNENFGDWEAGYRIDVSQNKDGQTEYLSGQLYGQHVRVYIDSMRKAAGEMGKTILIGVVTVEGPSASWATDTHKNWNTGMMGATQNQPDFYVVHNYYTPYNTNSNAADILSTPASETKKMMDYILQTLPANGASVKPVSLDEWNIFAVGSKQQVSHVNGMHAIMILGESLKNKFGMTARWDLANGWNGGNDQGMFSNGDEPGVSKWNPRPAFYHMYFFQKFLGDRLVTATNTNSQLFEVYASSYTSGQVGVTLVNKSTAAFNVKINIKNFLLGTRFYWYTLTGSNDNGEFSRKVIVNGETATGEAGGPANYKDLKAFSSSISNNALIVSVPARAVVCAVVENK